MSLSQSLHKSQIPINCHLCDIEKNIKWKCLECELLMCDNCKIKRHLRIKNSKDHKVIDIKDVGLHCEEIDFTNIKCGEHKGQSCCLFCKSCNCIVCPTCVSKVHKKHDLIEISELYDMEKDKLKKRQNEIKTEKDIIVAKKEHLERLKNDENAKYTRVIENIKNQGENLKHTVDKHIEKLKNEVIQNRKTVFQSIDADLDTISRSIHQFEEKGTEIEDLINNTNLVEFLAEIRRVECSMHVKIPKTRSSYKSIPSFCPGEITHSNVGKLRKEESQELSVDISIRNKYQTELTAVSHLIHCEDDSIWINSSLDQELIKFKPDGSDLKKIFTANIMVYGMTLTEANDLLLVTSKSTIQILGNSAEEMVDSVYEMFPSDPIAIHVTNDNRVIVGALNDHGLYEVIVMNTKGEREVAYDQDQYNQPIFTNPANITSTINGNIHVADYLSKNDKGKVVVLGQGGDVINTYAGRPHTNTGISFKPVGIATTPRDNVIVVALSTNTLHILDDMGQLLTFYETSDIGLEAPYSLACTQTEQLYIGCTRTIRSKAKEGKIYKLNISGC